MRILLGSFFFVLLLVSVVGCNSGTVKTSDVDEWQKQGLTEEEAAAMPDPNADR